MKQYLLLATSLLLSGVMLSQEKYPINIPTSDEKHSQAIFQLYGFMGAGINFAESHGVTPYEYGKYLGNLFAPSWSGNFNGFVEAVIGHNELTRRVSDPSIEVKENSNGSVTIISDEKMWRRYFSDDNKIATMNEFVDYLQGLYEPIADRMGATTKLELKDSSMVFTLMKKK
jgi:hypothetical protein